MGRRPMKRRARALALSVPLWSILCVLAPRAHAGETCPARPATRAAARKLAGQWWKKAEAHYAKGKNREAVACWQCAYKLVPHPLALYNIGRSAELAGMIKLAVTSYEDYLQLLPNASNKAAVEATLRGLRRRLQTQARRRVTPPPRRRTPPPRRRRAFNVPDKLPSVVDRGRTLRLTGWISLSAGVVLAAAAGAFGGVTVGAIRDVEKPAADTPYTDVKSAEKRARLFNSLTWICAGVGAAAVATGVTLLTLGYKRRRERRLTITPTLLPGGAAVTLGGRF